MRHSAQYELTLQAETLAVSAAKLPPAEEKDRAALEERIGQIRHLGETLDLLYDAFTRRRLGAGWPAELGARAALAATRRRASRRRRRREASGNQDARMMRGRLATAPA